MLLISDVTAVTMNPRRVVLREASIAVAEDRIEAVGKSDELTALYPSAERLDGRGMLAVPGLIDTHAHADQSILRGRTDDVAWVPFLAEWINPYLAQRDEVTLMAAYRLAMAEMIRSGTTCFVSPNVDPRDDLGALTEAIDAVGIRAVLARWVDSLETLETAVAAVKRWDGVAGGRVRLRLGLDIPRLPTDRYQPELYAAAASRAADLGCGLVYHFCSEIEDWTYYEDRLGLRPAQWAAEQGILGPRTLLINGCWLSAVETAVLAATATPVAHSPSANMKMASGVAPVRDLRDAGVTVSLGTDGGANNNSYDLIREMKTACLLQNSNRRRFGTLTAEDALDMATVGGALAIDQLAQLGSLEAGKQADIVLIDLERAHTWPVTDPVSNLVYAAHGGNVDTVMIGGRIVLRDGRPQGIDEATILADAAAAADRLDEILPFRPRPWPHE